jgi:hypothetical protein
MLLYGITGVYHLAALSQKKMPGYHSQALPFQMPLLQGCYRLHGHEGLF